MGVVAVAMVLVILSVLAVHSVLVNSCSSSSSTSSYIFCTLQFLHANFHSPVSFIFSITILPQSSGTV